MKLENAFDVPASPDRTWTFLNDVPRVVPCMPGAELTEVVGDDAWKASMKVKFGPVALQFLTDIEQVDTDEAARRTGLSAKAKEAKGRGGATANISSVLTPAGSGTRVEITTDLTMHGAVAQYGRGVVEEVANQMVRQFAANIAAQLAEDGDHAAPASEPDAGAGAGASGTEAAASAAPPVPVAAEATEPPPVRPAAPVAAPVGGIRLLFKALLAMLRNTFRRSRP